MSIKNKIKFLLVIEIIMVVFLLLMSTEANASDNEIVEFGDPDLKEILINMGYDCDDDKELSREEMKYVDDLECLVHCSDLVTDIKGLEYAINLEKLCCSNVKDITPISNLKKLSKLWVFYSELDDVKALENLENLEYLNIKYTTIKDKSSLSKVTSLRELYMRNCALTDISMLGKLFNLEILDLYNEMDGDKTSNEIIDITPLENLDLQQLYLAYNKITDISALKKMYRLETLTLRV